MTHVLVCLRVDARPADFKAQLYMWLVSARGIWLPSFAQSTVPLSNLMVWNRWVRMWHDRCEGWPHGQLVLQGIKMGDIQVLLPTAASDSSSITFASWQSRYFVACTVTSWTTSIFYPVIFFRHFTLPNPYYIITKFHWTTYPWAPYTSLNVVFNSPQQSV